MNPWWDDVKRRVQSAGFSVRLLHAATTQSMCVQVGVDVGATTQWWSFDLPLSVQVTMSTIGAAEMLITAMAARRPATDEQVAALLAAVDDLPR